MLQALNSAILSLGLISLVKVSCMDMHTNVYYMYLQNAVLRIMYKINF
jgi:hypothetical protein